MAALLLFALTALLTGPAPMPMPASLTGPLHVSAPASFWRELPAAQARRLGQPRLRPTRYRVLTLDLAGIKKALAAADPATGPSLLLPLPDGSQRAFQMRASSVLAPALAAKYPELRTYAGQAASPADYVRLEITPAGLRAMLVYQGRTCLIEPYRAGDTTHYLCFDKAALPAGSKAAFEIPGGPVR